MKRAIRSNHKRLSPALRATMLAIGAAVSLSAMPGTAGGAIFVADMGNGTIGEYSLSGSTINATLLARMGIVSGLAVSGGNLFVVNQANGTIGEYSLSGATVNASLITGATFPGGLAVFGKNLFVGQAGESKFRHWPPDSGTIGEYTLSGSVVNAKLVTGLNKPGGMVVVP